MELNSLLLLLEAAEYLERRDREAEHGYASVLPFDGDFARKKTKTAGLVRKAPNNRSSHNELEKHRDLIFGYLEASEMIRGLCYPLSLLGIFTQSHLKQLVPLGPDSTRHTTLSLLKRAKMHIKKLEEQDRRALSIKEQLQREHRFLKRRLEQLSVQSVERVRTDSTGSAVSTDDSEQASKVAKKSSVHYSVLAEHEETQSLGTKNPESLITQTPRGSIELCPQPSITKLTCQLSAGQVQNSISSLGLSSYLIPQCDQEASVLPNMEHKRQHFLKENIGKEDKDNSSLKRKYITCSKSSEKASKHTALEKDTDGTESWPNSRDTRALGERLCDVRYLGDLAKAQLMDALKQAAALVVTLMYKDGSTQLSAKEALTCTVKGIVVLLKSHVGNSTLTLPAHGGALEKDFISEDHCVYIHTEHSPFWDPKQEAHSLFVRNILFWTLRCKCPVVCFNAKDFVRTVLQLYGEDGSWKHVADFVGLDPRVAAWLIDPSDTAPSFEDLVAKHLEKSITVKPSSTFREASRNTLSQNVFMNLKILYDLTMDLCSKLKAYGLWQLFCTLELPLIPILAVMENHKIPVDKEEMERTSALLGARLKELEQEAHFVAGEQFLIMSNNQLREILFGKLKLHLLSQRKHLPRTGLQNQLSTSEAMLNSLQDLHPLPKLILEYRQGSISSTWNQTGTVTGRLSAKHPNIQGISKHPIKISKPWNFKGKEEETVTISPRTLFVSSEGHTFLAADFSQIELRILAHLSGDPELLKLFQESERDDVFSTLTSQWKDIPIERVTHMDREQTKKVVYSVVYGAGKERLAACLGVTVLEATHFLERFLQKYKKIKDFAQTVIGQCHSAGYVTSILGRRRPLPRICAQDQQLRAQAERQAVNFVVQGSAADLCKLAMIRISTAVATSPTLTASSCQKDHGVLATGTDPGTAAAGAPKSELECWPLMGTPDPTAGDPGLSLTSATIQLQ